MRLYVELVLVTFGNKLSFDQRMDVERELVMSCADVINVNVHSLSDRESVEFQGRIAFETAESKLKNFMDNNITMLVVNLPSSALLATLISRMLVEKYGHFYAIRWSETDGKFLELILIGELPE